MALTKSAARTRVRQHIRDTVTTYEYSDTILDGYLAAALKEIGVAVRAVDPNFYLRSQVFKLYTDALDKVDVDEGEQGFEFYPLPPYCASVRWFERSDGGYHYKIPIVDPRDQENHRFAPFTSGRVTKDDGVNHTVLEGAQSVGCISIWGDRWRIVPAVAAAGQEVRCFYDEDPPTPTGESEPLKIPYAFEEAFTLAWARKPVEEDDEAMAAAIGRKLLGDGQIDPGELARARSQHRTRTLRTITPRPAW